MMPPISAHWWRSMPESLFRLLYPALRSGPAITSLDAMRVAIERARALGIESEAATHEPYGDPG